MPQGNIQVPSINDENPDWDPAYIRRLTEYLRERELLGYDQTKDVLITGEPDSAGRRPHLVLRSPDGNYWRVTVDNAGVLSTTAVDPNTFTRAGVSLV